MFPRLGLVCIGLALLGSLSGMLRQLWLLRVHAPAAASQPNQLKRRIGRLLLDGVLQRRIRHYRTAGVLHQIIFYSFLVLLPRILVLLGRTIAPGFGAVIPSNAPRVMVQVAHLYQWLRDLVGLAVLLAIVGFAWLRIGPWERRLKPTPSALMILAVIATLVLSDFTYEAAAIALAQQSQAVHGTATLSNSYALLTAFLEPFASSDQALAVRCLPSPITGSLSHLLGAQISGRALLVIGVASFGLHGLLVLGFLLILPFTKHFHIVLALPNLFLDRMDPPGKIAAVARSEEELLAIVEVATEPAEDRRSSGRSLGKGSLRDYSPKERMDLLACTACGRCTDSCPAANAGKPLDPQQITRRLRTHLESTPMRLGPVRRHLDEPILPKLVGTEALWSCTTCGACEEQCPVGVRYVQPLVDLRRHSLLMRGEAPTELQRAFDGMQRQHNPWGLPRQDRMNWTQGLRVAQLKDVGAVEYLYWVGCAASFDPRAGEVARTFVRLMQRAGIEFAVLGSEELCTGDSARRAGNELLFLQLAEQNIARLNRYQSEGRFRRIVTACPHCLTTIRHEYAELGGNYSIQHHSEALHEWLGDGRLTPGQPSGESLAYHDPCTLARYAGLTAAPRELLTALTGSRLSEAARHGRNTACCGMGGAQMWMKDQCGERINRQRYDELRAGTAARIVTTCPFCLSALSDAATSSGGDRRPDVCDLAEVVEQSLPRPKTSTPAE